MSRTKKGWSNRKVLVVLLAVIIGTAIVVPNLAVIQGLFSGIVPPSPEPLGKTVQFNIAIIDSNGNALNGFAGAGVWGTTSATVYSPDGQVAGTGAFAATVLSMNLQSGGEPYYVFVNWQSSTYWDTTYIVKAEYVDPASTATIGTAQVGGETQSNVLHAVRQSIAGLNGLTINGQRQTTVIGAAPGTTLSEYLPLVHGTWYQASLEVDISTLYSTRGASWHNPFYYGQNSGPSEDMQVMFVIVSNATINFAGITPTTYTTGTNTTYILPVSEIWTGGVNTQTYYNFQIQFPARATYNLDTYYVWNSTINTISGSMLGGVTAPATGYVFPTANGYSAIPAVAGISYVFDGTYIRANCAT